MGTRTLGLIPSWHGKASGLKSDHQLQCKLNAEYVKIFLCVKDSERENITTRSGKWHSGKASSIYNVIRS